MILVALGTLLLILFFGAALIALFFAILAVLIRIGIALIIGIGAGLIVAVIAGAAGVDSVAAGVGIGLLSVVAAFAWLSRSKQNDVTLTARRPDRLDAAGSRPATDVRDERNPLIPPHLAHRLTDATREFRTEAAADPMNTEMIDWCCVLERVPELITDTEAMCRNASSSERSHLHDELVEDLDRIASDTERRLTAIRRGRHAVLRRWVAIRTGRA